MSWMAGLGFIKGKEFLEEMNDCQYSMGLKTVLFQIRMSTISRGKFH